MEQLLLTARVAKEDEGYVARVEQLPLAGFGESVQDAEDELIQAMRSWIEAQDGLENLEQALADAGFPGVEEDTELQLEFLVESLE
jgi:predicted RNase H-like HicB family nuclease